MSDVQFGSTLAEFGSELSQFGGDLNLTSTIVDTLANATSIFNVSLSSDATIVDTLANSTSSFSVALSGSGLSPRFLAEEFDAVVADPGTDHVARMGHAYGEYARMGIVPGVNILAGGDNEILKTMWYTDNTPTNVTVMASKICEYWRTMTTPGAPSHGGTVVQSVVVNINDSYMLDAITSMITDVSRDDAMFKFIESHQLVLTLLSQWEVTEIVSGVPTTFTEVIR